MSELETQTKSELSIAPKKKLDSSRDNVSVPGWMFPAFKTSVAFQNGTEKNILFKTWGGIGDQICAEPTLRHAFKAFKGCSISLATERAELFSHLPFKKVYNLTESQPYWDRYFTFETIVPPSHLMWQFASHCLTNCVDFPSLCALRMTLPTAEKEVTLKPNASESLHSLHGSRYVFVHAGRHWPSKTFPADWWNEVLAYLIDAFGKTPVLIGGDTDDNRGTVDIMVSGNMIDLRNKLTLSETIYLLQNARVLLTNDSAPLHMAASKPRDDFDPSCWIGYIATCKHPEYITHWRNGQWGYKMQNHGLGGLWDVVDHTPNQDKEVTVEFVEEDLLRSWLPAPKDYAEWAAEKSESP